MQERYRGPKAPDFEPGGLPGPAGIPPSAAPMLYTGDDPEAARQLMEAMWARQSSITDAVRCLGACKLVQCSTGPGSCQADLARTTTPPKQLSASLRTHS